MFHRKDAHKFIRQEMVGLGHRKEVLQAERTCAQGTEIVDDRQGSLT